MDIVEILGKIGFDWRMALANLVNFLIIFWLLKRFAFKPIKQKLDERESVIKKGTEDAEKAASELVSAKTNYDRTLTEARKEAQEIIAKAHAQAEEMNKKAATDTEARVKKIVTDARVAIEKEKAQMEYDLQQKTGELAVELAEKIIREKLTSEKDAALVKDLLKN